MLDPQELIALARDLANTKPAPNNAHMRRAVSTAYYAVFHHVLRAAAERFMGPNQEQSAGYSVLYRTFNHMRMREACDELAKPSLKPVYARILGRSVMSQKVRDFATAFPPLQTLRHTADYDPKAIFLPSDILSIVDAAEVAMDAFDKIPSAEQADVLAVFMVAPRG